jgi:hypothetical protein
MDAALARALAYPYDIPDHSFVFDPHSGTVRPSSIDELHALCAGRNPVLAAGSNAAPEQLRRKFPPDGPDADLIPVVRADIDGVDVVYAARIAAYGAMPATPIDLPGTTAHLHLTFLTDSQLRQMNDSEAIGIAYAIEEMDATRLTTTVELGGAVLQYVAIASALCVAGEPVALHPVRSSGRRLTSWTQLAMLTHVGGLVDLAPAALVRRSVDDPEFRAELNERLAELAT